MKRLLLITACLGLIPLLAACAQTPLPVAVATATPAAAVASPTVSSLPTPTPGPTPGVEAFPTPNPNPECVAAPIPEDPNIPPPAVDDWSEGAADAPIVLLEYSDFQ